MQQLWNKLPLWAKIVVVTILCIIVYKIVKKLYADYKINSLLNKQQKHYTVPVYDANGNPLAGATGTQVTFDATGPAQSFYDAIYDYGWFGYGEDETAMLAAINSVPTGYMPLVETAYTALYKKNMQQDAISYFQPEQWQQVKARFDEK